MWKMENFLFFIEDKKKVNILELGWGQSNTSKLLKRTHIKEL